MGSQRRISDLQVGRGRTSPAEQDGGPEQQGRKKRGKEVPPFGWPETTYRRGQRRRPPVRKQWKGVALPAPDPGTQGEAQIFQGYLFVGYIFPEWNPNAFVFVKSTIVSKEKRKQTSWSKGFP